MLKAQAELRSVYCSVDMLRHVCSRPTGIPDVVLNQLWRHIAPSLRASQRSCCAALVPFMDRLQVWKADDVLSHQNAAGGLRKSTHLQSQPWLLLREGWRQVTQQQERHAVAREVKCCSAA